MIKSFPAATAALACLAAPAMAQSSPPSTVTASAATQEFSDDFGSLRTVQLEYKLVNDDTTVLFTPVAGERRAPGVKESAVGGGVTVYRNWTPAISTRTRAFISEDAPVFAQHDLAQDLTVKLTTRTTVTVGARLARYFGKRDVTTLMGGARQYFAFGSLAYRASWVDPEGRDAFLAHLVNATFNDPEGRGRTRLWLSAGEASLTEAQVPDNFSGDDYAAVVQRVQPISRTLALVPTVGYSSYDRVGGRVDAFTLGLGLEVAVD